MSVILQVVTLLEHLQNGNSNIRISSNSSVGISARGVSNVLLVSGIANSYRNTKCNW